MSGQLRELIKEAPISQIIGHFIPLKRQGRGLVGLCPFHNDSKPSMTVNDQRGLFRCWACNTGGDALTFVKDFKKVDFIQAMKLCADILGLSSEELNRERKKNPKLELAFRVLNFSHKVYKHVADQKPMHFQKFIENRGLNAESLQNFQICYAPGNNIITSQLEKIPDDKREEARKMALELNLIRINENQGHSYDFYRDRVVFPVHDHSGQVRGFQCRSVLPNQNPKFLNSADSFVFHKASILYGFHLAKNAIRQHDHVFLVEGNMDVVMMHQHGFTHTVGTMGIALSESSLRLLSNMTKNVILAMDSDPAGIKAMVQINASFMEHAILPRYLSFHPAKDPDEFLQTEGRMALLERVEKAPRFIDWYIEQTIPTPIPEVTDKKLQILNQIFELLAPLKDSLEATERVISSAKLLKLRSDETSLIEQYKASLLKNEKPVRAAAPQVQVQATENNEEDFISETESHIDAKDEPIVIIDIPPMQPMERNALKTLITHPETLTSSQLHEILANIGHPEVKEFLVWLIKIYLEIDEQEYVPIISGEVFSERYGREIKSLVAEALDDYQPEPLNEKVIARLLQDLKVRLMVEQKRQRRKELTLRQKQCDTQEEVIFTMQEITKIDRELQELKKNPI